MYLVGLHIYYKMIHSPYNIEHKRNLTNNVGGGGQNRPLMLGIKIYKKNQVRKRGKVCLNQSLTYIHSFPPRSSSFFHLLFNPVAKRKLFLGRKNIGGTFSPTFSALQATLMYECTNYLNFSVYMVCDMKFRYVNVSVNMVNSTGVWSEMIL